MKTGMVFVLILLVVFTSVSSSAPALHRNYRRRVSVPHQALLRAQHNFAATRSDTDNLVYHRGPVLADTMDVYVIFWEPLGSSVSRHYNDLILRYFRDVGASPLYHNNIQYKARKNQIISDAVLAGSWVDSTAYPAKTISNQQIQGEISHAIDVNGWESGRKDVFFIFFASGENICNARLCGADKFCSYHAFSPDSGTPYAAILYIDSDASHCNVPFSPNNDLAADNAINMASHEQMEIATDPFLNAWYDTSGNEIGDKCFWKFGDVVSGGGDVLWNGHAYLVQMEWDNAKDDCVLAGP